MDPIETKNQLWRLCTNFASYRSLPGGAHRLQIEGTGFDSLAACQTLMAGGRVVKAPVCKTGFRGFKSRPAIQNVLVTPTERLRTEAH